MEIRIMDFKGLVKWLVTTDVIFVDPLYVEELMNLSKARRSELK